LIDEIGTVSVIEGVKRGPLTNQARGGQGGRQSDEVLKKMSDNRSGTIWITDGVNQKNIKLEDLSSWELQGWKRGVKPSEKRDAYFQKDHPTANTVWIHKNGVNKRAPKDELQNYLNAGWLSGHEQTRDYAGTMWITNGIDVKKQSLDLSIPDGWWRGKLRQNFPEGYKKKPK
jgi:hypothetical protein